MNLAEAVSLSSTTSSFGPINITTASGTQLWKSHEVAVSNPSV